jgi:hypothetical protein
MIIMTAVADTPFAKLDADGRLVNPSLKADTKVAGRFGYRGDIKYDGDQILKEVFAVSENGKPAIGFLAGQIKSFEALPKLVESFGSAFDGEGKYLIYCSDLPQGNRFYIKFGDVKIFAIFLDGTSVYNDLLETFYVDKVKLKKYDTTQRLDALADVGLKYAELGSYAEVSYDEGLRQKNAA